jgi:hypothetical protein
VGGSIVGTAVGLDFHEAPEADLPVHLAHEHLAQHVVGHLERVALEESGPEHGPGWAGNLRLHVCTI